jgi:protein-tyrosine kinase
VNHSVLPIAARAPESVPKSSMGRMLVEQGKLTPRDAERIAQFQREKGLRFGEAAQQLQLVSELDVRKVLACQFDFPYLQPDDPRLDPELVAAYDPHGPAAEVLRAIRSQLLLRWFEAGRKGLAVVGINPGDGSSRLCANLAISLAQIGKHVLLIDGNLKRPRQEHLFRLGKRQGLSDLLAGRCGNEVVQHVAGFRTLSVLPAGTPVPNPQELLGQSALRALLDTLGANRDVVLVDAPAFSFSADAFTLAARVGGVLLLVRKDATRLADVNAVNAQLGAIGVEVVGSVLLDT